MKFSSIIVGAAATLAAAAPHPNSQLQSRNLNGIFNGFGNVGQNFGNNFILNDFNNFKFANNHIGYLAGLGFWDADIFQSLILQQNLGFDNFRNLFLFQNNVAFGLEQILQLHAISMIGFFAKHGFFNKIDFGGALIPSGLEFGLLSNNFGGIGGFNFGVDVSIEEQITTIIRERKLISF